MNPQPQFLNKDDFKAFVDSFKKVSALEGASSLLRTKYTREMAKEDNDKREKQLDTANENLEELLKAVERLSKTFSQSNEKIVNKLNALEKSNQYRPVSDIKDSRPTSVREDLKSGVASAKRFGSAVAGTGAAAFRNVKAFAKDPMQASRVGIEKLGRANEKLGTRFGEGIKDILGTPKEYTVQGGRFAEAFERSPTGGLMQGKKTGYRVGLDKFEALKSKEADIKKLEEDIKVSTSQGFEAPKGKQKELDRLKSEYADLDPRNSAKAKIEKTKPVSINPKAGGVAQPQEEIVNQSKKQSESFKELLNVSKLSLVELKGISKALGSAPSSAQAGQAPQQQAGGTESGGGVGDMIGDAVGGKVMGGIGGKLLGGIKAGGAMLGKGALAAGKMIGGAALAKPALIAAGVGLAAYGAYKGYQALTGGDKGGAEGAQTGGGKGESTRVQAEETTTISLAKFAENDPKGFQEYQKFIQEEMDKGEKQIEEDFKSGKKKGAKEVFLDQLERDVQERARAKFKDKMMAAGAMETKTSVKGEVKGKDGTSREMTVDELKAQRQKVAEQGPRTKTAQSQETHQEKLRTMDAAIADKERKQAAVDPTGMGDDSEYKRVDTGSLRQGQQGVKAQHEQFMKDTKPGSGYKEEAPKKTIGQRIASFFGFGDKEEEVSKLKKKALDEAVKAVEAQLKKDPESRPGILEDEARNITDKYSTLQKGKLSVQTSETLAKKAVFIATTKKQQGPAANVSGKDEGGVDPTGMGDDSDYGPIEDQGVAAKGRKLREEATKLGLDPNKVQGKFEGGVLTGITDDTGKTHNVSVSAKDQGKVDVARSLRAANEKSATLAQQIPSTSSENAAMKDQLTASGRTTQPIVANNVQTNNTTTYMPVKADPRPGHRGSALDRYNDRIATF